MKNIENIRHSLAHLLAAAVLKKFPKAKFAIGPIIQDGFYYDFLLPRPLIPDDLKEIEKEIRNFIKSDLSFSGKKITSTEAKKTFKNQSFKTELINELITEKKPITIYKTGEIFLDLCVGGHVKNTREINPNAFKLTKIAGAYWRGDEKNPQLQRIYGVAFETKKELDDYFTKLEEAKKRDHRKLGKQLDLFTFSDLVGSGLPLYTPKGALIRKLLNDYVESLQSEAGYTQVWTPQIAKGELYKISGHYDKYKENMFKVISNYSKEEFYLKPMNCPQHTQIYSSQLRSYRDLPLRFTDFAMLYRDEKPGELNGLARVRSFSQDDCHIFCREDQVDEEVDKALSMTKKIMQTFSFKYRYRLSTRDKNHQEKYIGDKKTWDKLEDWTEKIMKRNKIDYFAGPGEAAFYGPKMDLIATDVLGREWQLSTVQIDFFLPERFNLTYVDKDGKEKRPVMIHRAIIGSPERFIMILLEHFAGAFPVWLSPVQTIVLPISEKQNNYANEIFKKLKENSIRTEIDMQNAPIGKKIRDAQIMKIPSMLIVGEKEEKTKTVAERRRSGKDFGQIKIEKFIENIKKEIEEKTL